MAGQIENRNATRHGLSAGRLPKGCSYVKRSTDQLRTVIEDAIIASKGRISVRHAALVQSAVRWERHAMLAQRWLRLRHDQLTPDQLLSFSREVARASSERDKCLAQLPLDADARRVIDALYAA